MSIRDWKAYHEDVHIHSMHMNMFRTDGGGHDGHHKLRHDAKLSRILDAPQVHLDSRCRTLQVFSGLMTTSRPFSMHRPHIGHAPFFLRPSGDVLLIKLGLVMDL